MNVGAVWHMFREHVEQDTDVLKRTKAGRSIVGAVQTAPRSPDEILETMNRIGASTARFQSRSLPGDKYRLTSR